MTQKHLKLHSRATCILEMMEKCEWHIEMARTYLQHNQTAPWFNLTKNIYEKEYFKFRAIKSRLVAYYADVMERLIRPAMESNVRVNENGFANPILERLQP